MTAPETEDGVAVDPESSVAVGAIVDLPGTPPICVTQWGQPAYPPMRVCALKGGRGRRARPWAVLVCDERPALVGVIVTRTVTTGAALVADGVPVGPVRRALASVLGVGFVREDVTRAALVQGGVAVSTSRRSRCGRRRLSHAEGRSPGRQERRPRLAPPPRPPSPPHSLPAVGSG